MSALILLFIFALSVSATKDEPKIKVPSVVVVPIVSSSSSSALRPRTKLGTVQFASGSSAVEGAGFATITAARDRMLADPDAALLLVARTDTVATEQRNMYLARQRGDAVRDLLVKTGGLSPARVFVAPMPKSDLPTITIDQEANSDNRSVEVFIVEWQR